MKIVKGTQPTATGSEDWFTGTVFVDPIQSPGAQSTLSCGHVRFAPGARTAWHTHPKGQTLYVTDGVGRVGHRSGKITEIHPGDVIFIEPNEEHWHGAAPNRFMAHVAIAEADENGQVVTWGEHVTDEEYAKTYD
jgi:quercetin dioxygenase-like cupin family protein